MDTQLQLFESEEFGVLEILMIEDKPYFPATECAKLLGYSNPHKAISDHCPHLTKREVGVETGKKADGTPAYQVVQVNLIPEGDLYRLIARSKLPAAVRFENFVFDEVLPTLRKHGAYITENTLRQMIASPEFSRDLMIVLLEEKAAFQNKINELAPKAQYCDDILHAENAVTVTVVAQDYGMSAVKFNRLLHKLKIQRKVDDTWVLYQEYAGQGYTDTQTYHVNDTKAAINTLWTQKGRLFLYEKLKEANILPVTETSSN